MAPAPRDSHPPTRNAALRVQAAGINADFVRQYEAKVPLVGADATEVSKALGVSVHALASAFLHRPPSRAARPQALMQNRKRMEVQVARRRELIGAQPPCLATGRV